MANEMKQVFASATTVISHAAAIANNAYTYTGLTGLTMTQLDNSTALYPFARAVLNIPDTFAAAPTAGSAIYLRMTKQDVDGSTDDIPPPDSTAIKNAPVVGIFPIQAYDVAQVVTINIDLKGVAKADFYLENQCGQQLSYTSNPITVKVTPFTFAPT